jgi:long-chain acyl-CoA synthetase
MTTYQPPQNAEAAVVGRANPVHGEEPVLFVSLNSGAAIAAHGADRHLRGSLSKYKPPVEITILDDLPKKAVGKSTSPHCGG